MPSLIKLSSSGSLLPTTLSVSLTVSHTHNLPEPSAEALAQIKETLNYTIHLEKTYPGTDPNHPLVKEGQLPDYREMSWAQVCQRRDFV